MIDPESVRERFRATHRREPRLFSAPGGVNLIGEHTDYNDGFVLPIAIDRRTIVAAAPRNDRRVSVHSVNTDETQEFDLDGEGKGNRGIWLDYVEGVARVLESRGHRLAGMDLVLESDVPIGSGLSSSAALEVSVGLAMLSLAEADIDLLRLALDAQQAEHRYVGTMSGIMDQYVAALGRAGNALLIDCRHLDASPIPIDTTDIAFVVCDTNVRRELVSSEYNERRSQCEKCVELLRVSLPRIRALRDVTLVDFDQHGHLLPEPLFRRARHVVTENVRTLSTAIALRNSDFEKTGRFMLQSHLSLRDDFEVSVPELDAIVDISYSIPGVHGARMTGGGFGGSAIAIVRRDALDNYCETLSARYREQCHRDATIHVVAIADGAREIIPDFP